MPKNDQTEPLVIPIEWNISDDIVARYATNMLVQSGENEFFVSFFESRPPLLLGTPEQISKQVIGLKSVKANCVAQIIISAEKMPSFIEALQTSLKRSLQIKGEETQE